MSVSRPAIALGVIGTSARPPLALERFKQRKDWKILLTLKLPCLSVHRKLESNAVLESVDKY